MEKKKRRITTKLEEVFGIPFTEIINNNFSVGASRYEVQKRLLEMIVEKGLTEQATKVFPESKGFWDSSKWTHDNFGAVSVGSNPAFRPSSLYHAIKDARAEKEIENFDFFISNKGRKVDAQHKKPTLIVEFHCRNCKKRHKNNGIVSDEDINLRVYSCPSCQTFGKCTAKITKAGKTSFKSVVKVDGIRQEVFVVSEEDLTPVDSKTPGWSKDQSNTEEVAETKEVAKA